METELAERQLPAITMKEYKAPEDLLPEVKGIIARRKLGLIFHGRANPQDIGEFEGYRFPFDPRRSGPQEDFAVEQDGDTIRVIRVFEVITSGQPRPESKRSNLEFMEFRPATDTPVKVVSTIVGSGARLGRSKMEVTEITDGHRSIFVV